MMERGSYYLNPNNLENIYGSLESKPYFTDLGMIQARLMNQYRITDFGYLQVSFQGTHWYSYKELGFLEKTKQEEAVEEIGYELELYIETQGSESANEKYLCQVNFPNGLTFESEMEVGYDEVLREGNPKLNLRYYTSGLWRNVTSDTNDDQLYSLLIPYRPEFLSNITFRVQLSFPGELNK